MSFRQIAAGGLTLDEAEAQLARAQRIPFPNDWVQLAAGLSGPPGFSLQLPGVRSRCVCARLPAAAALSGPDCPRYFSRSSLFSFLKIAHLRRFVN